MGSLQWHDGYVHAHLWMHMLSEGDSALPEEYMSIEYHACHPDSLRHR